MSLGAAAWTTPQGRANVGGSRAVVGSGVPAVGGPCPADQTADGDDGVDEVEERVGDHGAALKAAGQAMEGVLPGMCPLHMPPPTRLDRGFFALVSDAAVQAAPGQQGAGVVAVVAGVEVDGDLLRQRPKSV